MRENIDHLIGRGLVGQNGRNIRIHSVTYSKKRLTKFNFIWVNEETSSSFFAAAIFLLIARAIWVGVKGAIKLKFLSISAAAAFLALEGLM